MGQTVAGRFPLRQCLSARPGSAVFLTTLAGEGSPSAVIRLVTADPHWESAESLSHPHLIRMFEAGRAPLAGREVFYLVMEYAEDNLAQVLEQRPLTPEEALEVLQASLDVLRFLHAHGFVHGRIRPSNVLAAGDRLKISPGNLRRSGDRAEDARALGALMAEALTQRRPAGNDPPPGLPDPFREIVRGCLDPSRRWTLDDIAGVLNPSAPKPVRRPRYALWASVAAIVLALAVVVAALRSPEPEAPPPEPTPQAFAPARPSLPKPSPAPKTASAPERPLFTPLPGPPQPNPTPAAAVSPRGAVVQRVIPEIPAKAQRTIRGSVRVGVRVRVDASGEVARAELDSHGPSRYFAKLALDAATRWRFEPRPGPSEWLLRFEFTAAGVEATAAPQ